MKDSTSTRAASAQPILALRSQETGDFHALQGEVLIGREIECDIQIRSIQVSRYHAKIIVAANALFVEDLQSSNGTFVNGVAIKRRTEIGLGDQVAFDDVVFRVTSLHSGGADATMMSSAVAAASHVDQTDRPAVEELIRQRDQKPTALDMTRRKADIQAEANMTMARSAPLLRTSEHRVTDGGSNASKVSTDAAAHRSRRQPSEKASRPSSRQVSKKPQRTNKVILAGLLIVVLVLALVGLLIT